jgi:hypothetical protein
MADPPDGNAPMAQPSRAHFTKSEKTAREPPFRVFLRRAPGAPHVANAT